MLGASETAAAAVGFPFLLVDLPPAAPVTLDFDWRCWREKTLLDSRRATINCPMMLHRARAAAAAARTSMPGTASVVYITLGNMHQRLGDFSKAIE
jgi:hypothetical protein